jgi:uncharacterized membrane protein
MWKCPKCDEQLEDVFDACWKCGTEDPALADLKGDENDSQDPQSDIESSNEETVVLRATAVRFGFPFVYAVLVIPLAFLLLALFAKFSKALIGILAAGFVLLLPLWRVCQGPAVIWAFGSWLLVAWLLSLPVSRTSKAPIQMLILLIAAQAIVVLFAGWWDRRRRES